MKLFAIIGQWLAAIAGIAGIGVEIAYGAHIGYILITGGAVFGFIFTKIRHEMKQ